MKFSEMQTLLKRYGFSETDPLAAWLNASVHEIETAFDWPWLEEGPVTVNCVPFSNTVVLPVDFRRIITIKDTENEHKLKYYDRRKFVRMMWDLTEVGLPEVYSIIDIKTIQLWRVPERAYPLEVFYEAGTPDMVAPESEPTTGTTVWPKESHYPIVLRAAALALQAENEEERAKTAQAEFDAQLLKLMGAYVSRTIDEPETVEDAQGYSSDYAPYRWSTY